MDARDPQAPHHLASVWTASAKDLAVADGYAYVASSEERLLRIYDVSNPANLQLVKKFPVTGKPSGVAVRGTEVFLAESGAGMRVFDVADPSTPMPKALGEFVGTATDTWISGDVVVVPTSDAGLTTLDISGCDVLDNSLFIPAAAAGAGAADSLWTTDVEVSNAGDSAQTMHFRFLPRDADNRDQAFTDSRAFQPGQALRYRDIWGEYMGEGAGAIEVRVGDPATAVVTSRTFNTSDDGTFGQGIPPAVRDQMIGYGDTARLIQLAQNPAFRTNVGFLNPTTADLDLVVEFMTADGVSLGTDTLNLLPLSSAQWNKAFNRVSSDRVDDGWVEVWTTTEGGRFFTYGSVVDKGTQDPTTILSQPAGALLIPAAASAPGLGDSYWTTDLEVLNLGDQPVSYQLRMLPRGEDNSGAPLSESFQLAARSTVRYADIWGELAGEGAGAIEVVSDSPDAVRIMSRTFTVGELGSYGQGIPAIGEADYFAHGEVARIIQLTQNPGFRSNVGFVNPTGGTIHLEVEFFAKTGDSLGTSGLNLKPHSNNQWSEAFSRVTDDHVSDGYVEVRTTTEGARFFAYGSVVDNRTQDPTTVLPR
jgi:hypothetical protein